MREQRDDGCSNFPFVARRAFVTSAAGPFFAAHGMALQSKPAARVGSTISTHGERAITEPALYLVRPDGTLYFGSVQTMPFARPRLSNIVGAIDFVLAEDHPARGEVVSLPKAAE